MTKKFIIILFIIFVQFSLHPENKISLNMEKVAHIGDGDPILNRINSIAEDSKGNFFLVDRKAFKVHKFSPDGNLILSFGQMGEGPGDLKRPARVYISENDEIIITDQSGTISYFDNEGKFLLRHNLAKLGYLSEFKYAGNDKFFAEKYTDLVPTLNLITMKPEMIRENILETFKAVAFFSKSSAVVFNNKEFTPKFYIAHYGNYSIAARGEEYKILIFDSEGKIVNEIIRDFKRPLMNSREKSRFTNKINSDERYSTSIKKGIIGVIPDKKNVIGGLAISDQYIFVERIKADISDMDSPVPVDVYDLAGKFLGSIKMKHFPLLMTSRYIYTKEKDEDENLLAVKYRYDLTIF